MRSPVASVRRATSARGGHRSTRCAVGTGADATIARMSNFHSAGRRSHPSASAAGRRRGPGRPRVGSENKRERILNEAIALFGSHGYAGTSLADIAAASDISKAGLLHHFSSKEELFAQVLERRDRRDRAGLLGDGRIEDPWELLDAFTVLVAEHPAHRWFAGHLTDSVTMIEAALERGKKAGTVRPQAPSRVIARSVVALSDGLQIQRLCSTTSGSAAGECLSTTMVSEIRLLIDGLKARWRIDPGARRTD